MNTKLTLFVAVLVVFSINLAHSQTKPNKEILPSGHYDIVWDWKIDDRLDNEDKVSRISLVVEKGKISGKAIGGGGAWENRNVIFRGEILTHRVRQGNGTSIIVLMANETEGTGHLFVFRGLPGKPFRGQWYWTRSAIRSWGKSDGGDAILRPVVKDRNLKKPKGE